MKPLASLCAVVCIRTEYSVYMYLLLYIHGTYYYRVACSRSPDEARRSSVVDHAKPQKIQATIAHSFALYHHFCTPYASLILLTPPTTLFFVSCPGRTACYLSNVILSPPPTLILPDENSLPNKYAPASFMINLMRN